MAQYYLEGAGEEKEKSGGRDQLVNFACKICNWEKIGGVANCKKTWCWSGALEEMTERQQNMFCFDSLRSCTSHTVC